MRKVLIAISNSATISSEGLIVQLLGVLIADVLIMDPHNAHLAISRFMPHASARPGLIAGPHSDMPATELVAPMPPSAPADHLACSEKPSASWRQRGGLAACGAALVFLASIHGDRGSGEKPCAAIGQGAAGRDDARGRPAAFRSAARPAAPGALMPTTAGFVVDENAAVFLV